MTTSRRGFLRLIGLAPVAAPFAAKAALDAGALPSAGEWTLTGGGMLTFGAPWNIRFGETVSWSLVKPELIRGERESLRNLDAIAHAVDTFSAFDNIAAHATDKLVSAVENVVDTVISETAFPETPSLPKSDGEVSS